MGWTKKSYDALFDWIGAANRPRVKAVLLADGLNEIVHRLESAVDLGEWYKITHEAAAAIGPKVVEISAAEAEIELDKAAAALGRKGGATKSERKTAAARMNARKGGRPVSKK